MSDKYQDGMDSEDIDRAMDLRENEKKKNKIISKEELIFGKIPPENNQNDMKFTMI